MKFNNTVSMQITCEEQVLSPRKITNNSQNILMMIGQRCGQAAWIRCEGQFMESLLSSSVDVLPLGWILLLLLCYTESK